MKVIIRNNHLPIDIRLPMDANSWDIFPLFDFTQNLGESRSDLEH